jgi:DNA topoisomerase-1
MQQDASSKLNMSAPDTMRIAQQLYEGVEIPGEGSTALVTYIRTDSVRVSPDMQFTALAYIRQNYGDDFAPKAPNFYKSKGDAQDAHEAIRPISLELTPDSLASKINRQQYRLYKLIYDRFIASQMTDAVYNTLTVHIAAKSGDGKSYGFKLNGKAVKFAGYTVVYNNVPEEDEDEASNLLPNMEEGDKLELKEITSEQKFTKPPSRFTDATLVKSMEENGIGRPSTYASIISVLGKREYTTKDGKAMVPTELGEKICDYMVEHFPDIMDMTFTAKMEGALDRIEIDGIEWQRVIESFYPNFSKRVMAAGRDGTRVKMEAEQSNVICDKCGATMVVRDGKYGKFLACPKYPECKNIKPYDAPVAKCPKCGKDVYKKKSKTGKFFYGCSGYPNCDFLSWDIPAPKFCPKCGSTMRMTVNKDSYKYTCTSKTCDHAEILPKTEADTTKED